MSLRWFCYSVYMIHVHLAWLQRLCKTESMQERYHSWRANRKGKRVNGELYCCVGWHNRTNPAGMDRASR